MKAIFTILLSASAVSCMPQPASVDGIPDIPLTRAIINDFLDQPRQPPPLVHRIKDALFPDETERAFRLEQMANIVVSYEMSGWMRIDNGPTQQQPVAFPDESRPPTEWIGFFDGQTKKSMIVIIVAKNLWDDAELASRVSFLNHYFIARGYQRIIIQQARGWGRPTHSDITVRGGKEIHFTSAPGIRRGLQPFPAR